MKGVTRKERIINAMLEGDASACAGVSREERNLAKVAKATCDGQIGGSGGGWDAVIRVSEEDMDMNLPTDAAMYTLEGMTVKEIREAVIAGNTPRVCVYKPFFYGEDGAITHIVETIWAGREGGYNPTRVEFYFNDVYMDAKVMIRATEADGITYVEKKEYTLT